MISIATIRSELNDIKYYYARREQFEKAFDSVGKNEILKTVEKYNRVICLAGPKLYELYVCLYIDCHTHVATAEALNYSENYIYKTNKKLAEFFHRELNKEAA